MYHDIHPCQVTAQGDAKGDPHVFAQGSQYSRVDGIGCRCTPPHYVYMEGNKVHRQLYALASDRVR